MVGYVQVLKSVMFTGIPSTSTLEVNHGSGKVTVIPDSDSGTGIPSIVSRSSSRKMKKLLKRKSMKSKAKSLEKHIPSEAEERAVFLQYLQSEFENNNAKTVLLETQNEFVKT